MTLQTNGLIIPRGMVLPLRLYHINGGSAIGSTASVTNRLKEHPIQFFEQKYYEGFSDIDSDGSMISVYYTIVLPIVVQRMKEGEMSTQVVYSQGRCEYIIHTKEKYLECRGTSWVAKKGLIPLMKILEVEFEGIQLNENSMVTLCRDAANVKTVQISNLDNPSLSQIQLSGEILDSAEWTIYRRQGIIRFFRGFIDLPTGGQISAQVTNTGSMLIYKRGEGIPAEDLIATVNMIMKLTKG